MSTSTLVFALMLVLAACSDKTSGVSSQAPRGLPTAPSQEDNHQIVLTPPGIDEIQNQEEEKTSPDTALADMAAPADPTPDQGEGVPDATSSEEVGQDSDLQVYAGVDALVPDAFVADPPDVGVVEEVTSEADAGNPEAEPLPVPEEPADAFVSPPFVPPANPTCDAVQIEQGSRCFNGCDDDLDGILDTLDPSCEGSCDINNPFCPNGTECDVTSERCEEPLPLEEQYPDPGVCQLLEEDHPCHDLCSQLFLSGQSCYWSDGAVHAIKDQDGDLVQDELVIEGLPVDNCPAWANPNQGEAIPNPCELPMELQVDEDDDLVVDSLDNCPYTYNPWQGIDDCIGMPPEGCDDGDDRTQDQWNTLSQWCEYRAYESQWFFWTHLCGEDRMGACGQCTPAPGEGQTPVVFNGWACTIYPDQDRDDLPVPGDNMLTSQYLDSPFIDGDDTLPEAIGVP